MKHWLRWIFKWALAGLLIAVVFVYLTGNSPVPGRGAAASCFADGWQTLDFAVSLLGSRQTVTSYEVGENRIAKVNPGCDSAPFLASVLADHTSATEAIRLPAAAAWLARTGKLDDVRGVLDEEAVSPYQNNRVKVCRILLSRRVPAQYAADLVGRMKQNPRGLPPSAACLSLQIEKMNASPLVVKTLREKLRSPQRFERSVARSLVTEIADQLPGPDLNAVVEGWAEDLRKLSRQKRAPAEVGYEASDILFSLGRLGQRAKGALSSIAPYLDSKNDAQAAAALVAISQIDPSSPEFTRGVKKHLASASWFVRGNVEASLKGLGTRGAQFIDDLTKKIRQPQVDFKELQLVARAILSVSNFDARNTRIVREVLGQRRRMARELSEIAEIEKMEKAIADQTPTR